MPYEKSAGAGAQVDEVIHGLTRITACIHDVVRGANGAANEPFHALIKLDSHGRHLLSRLHARGISAAASVSQLATLAAAVRDFFGATLDAYGRCLYRFECDAASDKSSDVEECCLKLASAAADRAFWEQCTGGPAHPHIWNWLGATFSVGQTGAPQREFLRAMAARTAALDLLPQSTLFVAERVLAFVLTALDFRPRPFAGATHVAHPGDGSAPCRFVRAPDKLDGLWFFSAAGAVVALEELRASLRAGFPSAELVAGEQGSDALQTVIGHLMHHWSETPPVRRFRRHVLSDTLSAVHGIDDLHNLFGGRSSVRELEWSLNDVSRGGLGAYVPGVDKPCVRAGELVGVRARGSAAWQLAVVRRTWIDAGKSPFVGLETLSRQPVLVHVDDGRVARDVILCDPIHKGEALRIAARRNQLDAGTPLFVTGRGGVQKLKPLQALMTGDGFELRAYQVL